MSQNVVQTRLASALAGSGTLTVSYPVNAAGLPTTAGEYSFGGAHQIVTSANDVFLFGRHFDITFNAASFVINWRASSPTLPAGTVIFVGLSTRGANTNPFTITGPQQNQGAASAAIEMHVRLGAPATSSATAVLAAVAVSGATTISTLTGALAVNGIANMDSPAGRNVTAVSSNAGDTTQTVTIRGYDYAGNKMTERLTLNGVTTVSGVKAFKQVTQLVVSATMTGTLSVGSGNVLGLPVYIPSSGLAYREVLNGALVSANTAIQRVPFFINQTDLLAPTVQDLIAPMSGTITDARANVQVAVGTGGTLVTGINGTPTTGGIITVANSATKGTRNTATAFTALNTVAVGDRLTITPASFATTGAVNGYIEITPATPLTAGLTSATATISNADVRGTYTPASVPNGTNNYELLIALTEDPAYLGQAQFSDF